MKCSLNKTDMKCAIFITLLNLILLVMLSEVKSQSKKECKDEIGKNLNVEGLSRQFTTVISVDGDKLVAFINKRAPENPWIRPVKNQLDPIDIQVYFGIMSLHEVASFFS